MGGVVVDAVHEAGRDDADGRLAMGLHEVDLGIAGMGAQHHLVVHVEGIVHVPGRMLRRDVQGFEVVPVIVDFGRHGLLEAEAAEEGDDLLAHLGERMEGAEGNAVTGQGRVHGRGLEAAFDGGILDALFQGGQAAVGIVAQSVDQLAEAGTLLGGEPSHGAQEGGDIPFLAQVADLQIVEGLLELGPRGLGLGGHPALQVAQFPFQSGSDFVDGLQGRLPDDAR
jgi:hypothetical protein